MVLLTVMALATAINSNVSTPMVHVMMAVKLGGLDLHARTGVSICMGHQADGLESRQWMLTPS